MTDLKLMSKLYDIRIQFEELGAEEIALERFDELINDLSLRLRE